MWLYVSWEASYQKLYMFKVLSLIINFLLRYISSSFYSVNNRIRIYIIAIGLKRCGILFLEIFLGFIIVFIVIALFVYCLRIFVSICALF